MVLSSNLYEGMQPSGDKMRQSFKYTWANGYQHEKENQGILGVDIDYRFK
jgi:hypothetical protein